MLSLVEILAAFFLLILGFYVAARLLVSVPVAVMEGWGARAAVRQSWKLTKGHTGRALLACLAYGVVAVAIIYAVQGPFQHQAIRGLQRGEDVRAGLAVGKLLGAASMLCSSPFGGFGFRFSIWSCGGERKRFRR